MSVQALERIFIGGLAKDTTLTPGELSSQVIFYNVVWFRTISCCFVLVIAQSCNVINILS
uniref:Uncharacterized protein n=1 Tax=Rhizophora mucronata TaxID=61149 RepID=A0A2P2QVD3_RHIMU